MEESKRIAAEQKAAQDTPSDKVKEELDIDSLVGGHATQSNNWVISGEHTESGLPLLSTDPHLSAIIPAFWQLNELIWEEKYIIGASLVGCPGISMGRSKDITWGLTASIVDNSDLWEEELSSDGKQYLVDD